MKTDAKTMAEVLRKIACNLENGINSISGIQFKNAMGAWIDKGSLDVDESVEYRIKPKTIIVNGVDIPKPLNYMNATPHERYYLPEPSCNLYSSARGDYIIDLQMSIFYDNKEEAIEASKKLFGIE